MFHMLYMLVKEQLSKFLDQKTESGLWLECELLLILFHDTGETEQFQTHPSLCNDKQHSLINSSSPVVDVRIVSSHPNRA